MISRAGCGPSTLKSSRLSGLTTLGVGGPPDLLVRPETVEDAQAAVLRALADDVPWRVLGRGSNLVVDDDGVDGVVLQLGRLRHLRIDRGGRVAAGAGLPTSALLAGTRSAGLGGLECLVGYPATVGGVARMNAGGAWGFVAERIVGVTLIDERGELRDISSAECGFGYRTSGLDRCVVVEVRFELPAVDAAAYRADVERIHDRKSATQPLDRPSAGCVFKNPTGDSAGRLVDLCGLKGSARGAAAVSEVHGNFVVNRGGARAADVLSLIDDVREAVVQRTGVVLDLEVEVWRRRTR